MHQLHFLGDTFLVMLVLFYPAKPNDLFISYGRITCWSACEYIKHGNQHQVFTFSFIFWIQKFVLLRKIQLYLDITFFLTF